MKCPECLQNHQYKNGMTCSCGYRFVLDPKRDGFADGKFLAAVRRASGDGSVYFTRNQLVTELNPKLKVGFLLVLAVIAFLGACALGVAELRNQQGGFMVPALFLLFFGLIFATCYLLARKVDQSQGLRALEKFEQAKGMLKMRLRDDRPLAKPPPEWDEDDIYDYGVEGILFVDREIIVDLLVMNQWHTANRILVVCESGYPSYIVAHVNRILEERPDLPLYALHDCEKRANDFVRQLKGSDQFQLQSKDIVDVSLRSEDLSRTPNLKRFATDGSVAVDHLRWERLSSGLAQSMVTGAVLVEVIGLNPESAVEWGQSYG